MIFYFTATGNSLYVAEHLDKKLISIPQIIKEKELHYCDETIGIVCPIYGSELPYMVQEFLKRLTVETKYFYILMTYGHSSGAAATIIHQILKETSLTADYIRTVKMVDNYLPAFDMNKENKVDKKIEIQLEEIRKDIEQKKQILEKTRDEDRQVYEGYLSFTKEHPELSWKNISFHATENCIGCGLCEKVCPAGCIRIEAGKAVHSGEHCQVCMACIHHCPKKAIQMNVPEINPQARYRKEEISIYDIIRSNQQISG